MTINPNELLARPTGVFIADLLDHVTMISSDLYLQALVDPEPGLYWPKSVTPWLRHGDVVYPRSQYGLDAHRIRDLSTIPNMTEGIVDVMGATVLSDTDLMRRRRYMLQTPDIPATCIQLAYTLAVDYLFTVARHSRGTRRHGQYHYIRPEYHYLTDSHIYEELFERLLDQVNAFIGTDTWHIYFPRLQNTTLIIEKTIDYRIYRYHELEWIADQHEEG